MIGNKVNVTKSTKLAYLNCYLRNYALSLIKHLSITDANYDIAIDCQRNSS